MVVLTPNAIPSDNSQHRRQKTRHASELLFSSDCDLYSIFRGHCYAIQQYRYWYWVLVSLEDNIIEHWILGAFLGIVLTLVMSEFHSQNHTTTDRNTLL